jgi:citrate lyase subunit beta/citryl-CoA lyase
MGEATVVTEVDGAGGRRRLIGGGMGSLKIYRSILAVPANNLRMVEKALASEADAVFLDLEDAVAPDGKAAARGDVVCALKELDWRGRPGLYRANALDTAHFYRDLIEVVEESGDSLDAVMVPKVNRSEDLHAVSILLSQLELAMELEKGKIKLEAQIESAEGLANVDSIASATSRLEALHFGPGDFAASVSMPQTSIGVMDEWDEAYPGHRFHYAMQRIVVAARATGLRVLDGPVADYGDEEGLRRSCLIARSVGFDGKWCIHPAQIAIVNETFSPTARDVEWAKKVVAAYEEANATGSGSVSVDGHMVDAASIKLARNTLGKVPKKNS